MSAAPLASSTPQPGEVWELSFYAKVVSGTDGNGFTFRFRGQDENGTSATRAASTEALFHVTGNTCQRYTVYTYDHGGNLLQKATYAGYGVTTGTPTVTTYVYGDDVWADLLTSFNGTAISYDEIGNPLNWTNGATLTWQHGRELGTYTNSDTAVSYTYNENGIRTSKTVNGVKTTYILDEKDRLVGEVTGENTTAFLYDESGCVYGFLYNGVPYYYLFNGQGDVVRVVDADGVVAASYNYDAWGGLISATGTMASVNPIRYRGYYYDSETALYYLQSRYYDPTVGRFLNADSMFDESYALIGYNMFTYAYNSPMQYCDPSGSKIVWNSPPDSPLTSRYMSYLKPLTNDRLYFLQGELIYCPGTSYTKPAGTTLLRTLIDSPIIFSLMTTSGETQVKLSKPRSIIQINTATARETAVPMYIIVGHELIHAYRYAIGIHLDTNYYDYKSNSVEEWNIPYVTAYGKIKKVKIEELFTVGIHSHYVPWYYYRFYSWITENQLRLENGIGLRYDYYFQIQQ